MAVVFVFPGQGSQMVGMGKALADNFAPARKVFDEVDEALGGKLSSTIFEGPAETLTLTENAQPALMAVSLAAIRVLQTEAGLDLKRDAQFVAGHSLGEYSALAAAREKRSKSIPIGNVSTFTTRSRRLMLPSWCSQPTVLSTEVRKSRV